MMCISFVNIPLDVRIIIYSYIDVHKYLKSFRVIDLIRNEYVLHESLYEDYNSIICHGGDSFDENNHGGDYRVKGTSLVICAALFADKEALKNYQNEGKCITSGKRKRGRNIYLKRDINLDCVITALLASGGHKNLLIVLTQTINPLRYNFLLCSEIGKTDNMDLLKWALQAKRIYHDSQRMTRRAVREKKSEDRPTIGLSLKEKQTIIIFAGMFEQPRILRWAMDQDIERTALVYVHSVIQKSLRSLRYFYRFKWPLPSNIDLCEIAVLTSDCDIFNWCEHHQKANMKTLYCCRASENGDIRMLQWLRDVKNCPWSTSTIMAAIYNGHFSVIRWCLKNGAPCSGLQIDPGIFLLDAFAAEFTFRQEQLYNPRLVFINGRMGVPAGRAHS